jgi:transposase
VKLWRQAKSGKRSIPLPLREPEPRAGGAPGPEVDARPRRRRHTAEYKARMLREADACAPGSLGALLRREGLYSSQLAARRKQQQAGLSQRRGRKAANGRLASENARMAREVARLSERLRKAELIIDVQKKLCIALGLEPHPGLEAE